jgi:hypothetical protein
MTSQATLVKIDHPHAWLQSTKDHVGGSQAVAAWEMPDGTWEAMTVSGLDPIAALLQLAESLADIMGEWESGKRKRKRKTGKAT